jgi:hypothetical protein
VNILTLLATTTKSTSAWAVGSGNGGLDTGAIAASTWYAVYIIKRTDTNVVDVIYSTNGTAPTLPTNYTLFRRIGWVFTNGSSQFTRWVQTGRTFTWYDKVGDVNNETPASTNRIVKTVTAPINTMGIFQVQGTTTTATWYDFGATALDDAVPTATNAILRNTVSATWATGVMNIQVDASHQIYYRVDQLTGTKVYILTLGWIDNL